MFKQGPNEAAVRVEPAREQRIPNVPDLIEAVRLDRNVPRPNAYEAHMAPPSLNANLALLVRLLGDGVVQLNHSPKSCALPLCLEVQEVTADLERHIGPWKVEARTARGELESIIGHIRSLGIDAVGVFKSPTGKLEDATYAWICADNYDDLKSITAVTQTMSAPLPEFEASLPEPPQASTAPARASVPVTRAQ